MKTLFFSVGEPSGDLHGANLIRSLQQQRPGYRCVGYGGPKMAAAGCELHEDLTRLAVMWLWRVLINLHRFVGLLVRADRYFREQRPDAVVLIDYPGFNWWIARRAKAHAIPVIYYGAPQLWAWAPWRVAKLRRLTDHVLCKLPFEEAWFRARGCDAHYVGHPYFDELAERTIDQPTVHALRQADRPLVTLLPGSRMQEVTANLPTFLQVVRRIGRQVPQAQFAIASFNAPQAVMARKMADDSQLDVAVHVGRTAEMIEAAHLCLACSGSVSLELLYHRKPSIILYRISRWAYWLQDRFRISRYITLVNLLATDRLERRPGECYDPDAGDAESVPMPEYLVWDNPSGSLADRAVRLLTDHEEYARQQSELSDLCAQYARSGASREAARFIDRRLYGEDQHTSELPARPTLAHLTRTTGSPHRAAG